MQDVQPNLFTRSDTFFGVCQGIGEDFGFSPQFLRIGLAVGLFFNPLAVIGIYAALGLVVLTSRLLFPDARRAAAVPVQAAVEEQAAVTETMPLAEAA